MLRVAFDLAHIDEEPVEGRQNRWQRRLAAWTELRPMFRVEGFYERFPAKGEVERVSRVQKELARAARIEVPKK